MFLAICAEKAFGNVQYQFRIRPLSTEGIEDNFLNLIKNF
jgi:hypothetical protein